MNSAMNEVSLFRNEQEVAREVSRNSLSFNRGQCVMCDSEFNDENNMSVSFKLEVSDDDDTMIPRSEPEPLSMDFETLPRMVSEGLPPPCSVWSTMHDDLDDCLPQEDSSKSKSGRGEWMRKDSMSPEAWEQVRVQETMDVASLRDLYWGTSRDHNGNSNNNAKMFPSTHAWSKSNWTSTTWGYDECA